MKNNPEQYDGMGEGMGPGMVRGGARGRLSQFINLRTIISFRNPVFRTYFGALLGQMMAMNM
jgi:hypothetical protein